MHRDLLLPLLLSSPADGSSEDRLSLLAHVFADTPAAVAILEGPRLAHAWANERWLGHLPGQVELSSILHKPLHAVLPEGELPLLSYAQRAMVKREVQRFEELHVHGAHGEAWLTGSIVPLGNRVVVQIANMSAQVINRRESRVIGGFAEQVLEQIPHPVVVLSRAGRVLRANNKARTRFGVERGQRADEILVAMDLRDDGGKPLLAPSLPIVRTILGETVEMRGTARDRLLGERRDLVFHAGPVTRDRRVTATLVSCIDVTELRRLERAKDEFLNIAAHELKTPLTALRAYLQLAIRKGLGDPKSPSLVESALQSSYRMQRLIGDMLDSARLETGRLQLQRERIDLARVVLDVEERSRRELCDGRTLEVRVEAPLVIEGDAVRIDQIIGNLLSNALRHGPPGRPVRLEARREEDSAVVQVRDCGAGIEAEEASRIFERLFRGAEARGDGLGLGLFIARELAELHGGSIDVDPGPGRGACFSLRLPLAASPFG